MRGIWLLLSLFVASSACDDKKSGQAPALGKGACSLSSPLAEGTATTPVTPTPGTTPGPDTCAAGAVADPAVSGDSPPDAEENL